MWLKTPKVFYSLIPAVVAMLLIMGALLVRNQYQAAIQSQIIAYQQTELELVRSVARSIEAYVQVQVETLGRTDVDQIEEEIFTQFIAPIHLLENGDAWIYAPDHVVFDPSSDFPAEYRGKSMAEIFILQSPQGARNYEAMTQAVMAAQEGVGSYIWLPEKGEEIAAWTPVRVRDLAWTVGLSTPLPEIIAMSGIDKQNRFSIIGLVVVGLISLAVHVLWLANVSRWQRMEAEFQTNQQVLYRVQQMESLGVLAGGVAHDFNNLLVGITGQSELAKAKLPANSAARVHIDQAITAARRAAELIGHLFAYTGQNQPEITAVNLNELIENNLMLFQAAIPKSIELASELTMPLPYINSDRGQIQQVLMNLIINAAEAIGQERGKVTVKTTLEEITSPNSVQCAHTGEPLYAGQYVVLTVKDNGCGMDAETLSKIFDPFFTTKFAGRGLGLASVLGIIRSHKGGMEIQSTPNVGTQFKIYMPATTETPPEPVNEYPLIDEDYDKLILIIDDEEFVRSAASEMLRVKGFEVVTVDNGEDGIDFFRSCPNEVVLVLLDLSMPGMTGEETLTQLRKISPSATVLVSSGYSQSNLPQRLSRLGAAGFIAKPYTSAQLHLAICRHLQKTRL
ncbi:MAG: response regulator [Caldilineaceae bacterium]